MSQALIIHGNSAQAEPLVRLLRQAGIVVEMAADSDAAGALAGAGSFEFVIAPGPQFAQLVERSAAESARRQNNEAALVNAEAMYRSFAEGLPIHLILKDLDGRFRFANGLFCRELGRTLAEIVGRTDHDFFAHDLAEKYRADDRQVAETRQVFQTVEEHRLPTGEKHFVEVLKAPVYDAAGGVTGVQIAFWDVTARQRAEEELSESESRNRAILQAALDCIITIDQQGKIIEFNPAAEETFGFRREEIVGRDLAETLLPQATRERHRDALDRYSTAGEMGSMLGSRFEQPMVRKNGQRFVAELCMQAIPLEGSTVFTLFLRDITERTRAEEEIKRKNRDLETLLYVTSHDLREPLRAVHNFAKLAVERNAAQLDAQGQDYLKRVMRGAERLDRLLEDVLTLSRAQRSIDPTQEVALDEVVADVLAQLDSRIERTRGRVRVDEKLPHLAADRRWVTQAVFNLVANALKFTRDGHPPEVEIAAYHPQREEPPGEGLVVSDRGPGVPAGYADRIFQLFQRAVGREVEGTGAGLG